MCTSCNSKNPLLKPCHHFEEWCNDLLEGNGTCLRNVAILRVRFFGKIQNWIIDLRSHGYFAPKETKNPKMDFCHDNAVNTFCTEHKIIGRNLFSVECILGKFTSAYKIFHKNHTTK